MAKKSIRWDYKWYLVIIIVDAVAIAWGWMYPVKLTLALLVQLVAIMYFDPLKDDWKWAIVTATLAPAVEILAIWQGAWSYTAPFILGFPIWGYVGYANAAILLRRLAGGKKL